MENREATDQPRRPYLLIAALAVSFAAAVAGIYFSISVPTPTVATPAPLPVAASPPPDSDYVGSSRCASCHPDVSAEYPSHPMAHSFQTVLEARPIERWEDASFYPPGIHRYDVEKTAEGCWHSETALDEHGEPIYSQKVAVEYALGSGQRGRTYLLDRGGLLFQSAIGWYSQGQKWDLSPGYVPGEHQRFSRRIGNGCLYCHVGRVQEVKRGSDRYAQPPFLERSIGCERCHGPGKKHVEYHQSGRLVAGMADPITNPARLEPERREAVCNQCHLQGTRVVLKQNRSFWDFRPGDHLDDHWLVFLQGDRTDPSGNAQAVSQVEQMYVSKCYVQSGQRLGCISCHDPHSVPPPEKRAEYYRGRCLECHADQGCSLPVPQQQQPPANGSCVACHMPRSQTQDVPHTSQTDHRVLRNYPPAAAGPHSDLVSESAAALELFGTAKSRVSPRELDRANALLMIEFARAKYDAKLAEAGRLLVLPGSASRLDPTALTQLGSDLEVLEAVGASFALTGQIYAAMSCWEQALRFDPHRESVLEALAELCMRHGNFESAERYLGQLLKINPYVSHIHFRYADLLLYQGKIPQAVAAAERALELDPTNLRLREWLSKAYLGTNQPDEGRAQVRVLERVEAAKEAVKEKPSGPKAP